MKGPLEIAKIFFYVVVGMALSLLIFSEGYVSLKMTADIEYSDLISVLLTALGVLLATLAVFLGAMALYSWRNFDDRVKGHVETYLDEFVAPSERFEAIKNLMDEHRETTKKLAEAEKELENLSKFDEAAV